MTTKRAQGFTIIELTLALMFVAILLLLVAGVTIRIGHMYEKGVTVKSLNQVGREVMDVLHRDIAQAGDRVRFESIGSGGSATYRLCLGDVSYVANTGEALNTASGTKIAYTSTSEPVTFVRVLDSAGAFCIPDVAGVYESSIDSTMQPVELLTTNGSTLAVHELNVEALTQSNSQSLYRLTLVIGTNEPGTLDANLYCRPNTSGNIDDVGANFNYCSVAEFTTIIRSGGANG